MSAPHGEMITVMSTYAQSILYRLFTLIKCKDRAAMQEDKHREVDGHPRLEIVSLDEALEMSQDGSL